MALSPGRVIQWFVKHQHRVTAYLNEKNTVCKPPNIWWVSLLTLAPIFAEIDPLFETIQGSVLLVDQQKVAFSRFLSALSDLSDLKGPLSLLEMEAEQPTSIKQGSFQFR